MFRWCTVFVGMSLAFAIPTKYTEPLWSEKNLNYETSASLDDLIKNIQRDSSREKVIEGESVLPKIHDVISLPNAFYINEYVDYSRPSYDGIEGTSSINYIFNPEDNLPIYPEQCMQSKQENIQRFDEDQDPTKDLMDINNYYDDNESIIPNIVEPLYVWPHVQPAYVPEKISSLETFDDIDVLNPANTEFLLSNTRPNRNRDYEFNELMAYLTHEAIIKNIVPTMSYVRDAEEYPKYPVSQTEVYTHGVLNGCALPILFNCSPNLYTDEVLVSFPQPDTPATTVSPPRGAMGLLDEDDQLL